MEKGARSNNTTAKYVVHLNSGKHGFIFIHLAQNCPDFSRRILAEGYSIELFGLIYPVGYFDAGPNAKSIF